MPSTSPDRSPLAAALRTAGPWAGVEVLDEVDSTNAHSLRDPRPWRIVVADAQNAGRGRRGRAWASPPGSSVALSATLPLPPQHPATGWLTLATGLAVRDAVEELVPAAPVTLKWPNDVLVDGRKVCGILAQIAPGTGLVVVGIGVNVTVPEADLPVPTATSLHRWSDGPLDRDAVTLAVAAALGTRYTAWAGEALPALRREYRALCATVGAEVRVHVGDGTDATFGGTATGVDDDGALVVETASGPRRFAAGDVVHVRPGA